MPLAPSAHAWPDPNKAIKDAQKAGKKASKKANSSAKKHIKNAKNSAPKKMVNGNVDICKTPTPAGPTPIPYPNISPKDGNKVKAGVNTASKNANKAAKQSYKNAKKTKKQIESAVKKTKFPDVNRTPASSGSVPIPYPNIGK